MKCDEAVCSKPILLSRITKKCRYNLKKSSVSSDQGAAEVMKTTGTKITKKKKKKKKKKSFREIISWITTFSMWASASSENR